MYILHNISSRKKRRINMQGQLQNQPTPWGECTPRYEVTEAPAGTRRWNGKGIGQSKSTRGRTRSVTEHVIMPRLAIQCVVDRGIGKKTPIGASDPPFIAGVVSEQTAADYARAVIARGENGGGVQILVRRERVRRPSLTLTNIQEPTMFEAAGTTSRSCGYHEPIGSKNCRPPASIDGHSSKRLVSRTMCIADTPRADTLQARSEYVYNSSFPRVKKDNDGAMPLSGVLGLDNSEFRKKEMKSKQKMLRGRCAWRVLPGFGIL